MLLYKRFTLFALPVIFCLSPSARALQKAGRVKVDTPSVFNSQIKPAIELYVAPNGSDNNPGTITQPLATFKGAVSAVRDLRKNKILLMSEIAVTFKAGVYPIADTIKLSSIDSGTPMSPTVYRAAAGKYVSFTGGKKLTGFKAVTNTLILARLPDASRGKVMQVDLKAQGITDYGVLKPYGFGMGSATATPELFVNGKGMTIARWPNTGWVKIDKVFDRGSVWGSNVPGEPELREKPDRGAIFEMKDPRITRWREAKDIWLFGYWWWDWAESAVQVDWIDVDKQQIKTVQPHEYGYRAGGRYYAYNLLEEIDTPGEWYIDRSTGILYLYPPAPLTKATVEYSQLDKPMVQLDGVSNVKFEGLTLETMRDTAIIIRGGNGCTVAGCTFRKSAAGAVNVEGGTNHRILGCDIYDTNGGIHLTGGDRITLTPGGHVAENNHIHGWARINKTYNPAITLSGVGLRASHNRIHDAPHMAIGFGGNDHIMEYNEIYDVCQQSNDAGAIYTGRNWSMRGNIIRYNFFHDIFGLDNNGAAAVYLDDEFSSADVIGNVFYRMTGLSFLIGGGRDNVIENNVTLETGPLSIDDRGLNWAKLSTGPNGDMPQTLKEMPYKSEPWRSRYPKLVNILEDDPGSPKGNVVRYNLFVKTREPQISEPARKYGVISNNWVTTEDPGFENVAALDLRIRTGAQVYKHITDFKPIPMDKIGLIPDAYRPTVPPLAPVVIPGGRAFIGPMPVTLTARTKGAVIRYTLDGSEPTSTSTLYVKPIILTKSTTLKAGAFNGGQSSDIVISDYSGFSLGNGKSVQISSLPWIETAGFLEPKRDMNLDGGPITIAGQKFEHGLLMHPADSPVGGRAHITYLLDGGLAKVKRYKASIGVDDETKAKGSVAFIVETFIGKAWRKAYESPVLKGGDKPLDIDVDIRGAAQLRLTVTDGGDNINSDHAAWGNPRLE